MSIHPRVLAWIHDAGVCRPILRRGGPESTQLRTALHTAAGDALAHARPDPNLWSVVSSLEDPALWDILLSHVPPATWVGTIDAGMIDPLVAHAPERHVLALLEAGFPAASLRTFTTLALRRDSPALFAHSPDLGSRALAGHIPDTGPACAPMMATQLREIAGKNPGFVHTALRDATLTFALKSALACLCLGARTGPHLRAYTTDQASPAHSRFVGQVLAWGGSGHGRIEFESLGVTLEDVLACPPAARFGRNGGIALKDFMQIADEDSDSRQSLTRA